MNKLKVLELFGGIGACSKALERLGVDYEIVDYVEIDKYAVASFNAIHNTNFEPQDICNYNKDIVVDLLMHGSPCQDFSLAGKQAGGDKDSGTRSSLMYETIRIVEKLKPKYVIWENVKNILSKKHKHNFEAYLEIMEQLGYTNYYQVLNAKDYGIPQNRERVFTVSILGNEKYEFPKGNECNNSIKVVGNYMPSGYDASRIVDENGLAPTVKENHGTVTAVLQRFEFPPKQELKLKLKDMLEDEVDEKYYLSDKQLNYVLDMKDVALKSGRDINDRIVNPQIAKTISCRGAVDQRADVTNFTIDNCNEELKVKDVKQFISNKYKNFIEENGYIPYMFNPYNTSEIKEIAPTQTTQCGSTTSSATVLKHEGLRIRKLTPKECWRLMGFDDEDFEKASRVNSNTQLYKQAGNSIVVNVLEEILRNLLL